MDQIRQYIISITVAAIICAIISGLIGKKGTQGSIIKLLCGLFLSITIISPWLHLDVNYIADYFNEIKIDAGDSVDHGQTLANMSREAIIKAQTEAYILDKASSMQLDITVEVTLSDTDLPVPYSVVLRGSASPYAKQNLQRIITSDLGIPEENQEWI